MDLVPAQLAALVAIADHGTFEAAARHLHVTPSAVSQRTTPCTPTADGEALLRLARQVQLLHDEANDALAHSTTNVDLPVAVNADSLATWFRGVLGEIAG